MKQIKRNEKGFTLVELVVVIAILAVLAALLIPRIIGNVNDAKASQGLADARTLAGEITTHNAIAVLDGTATIPAGRDGTGSDVILTADTPDLNLDLIGREAGDLPDAKYAENGNFSAANGNFTVDADGNATVKDKTNSGG